MPGNRGAVYPSAYEEAPYNPHYQGQPQYQPQPQYGYPTASAGYDDGHYYQQQPRGYAPPHPHGPHASPPTHPPPPRPQYNQWTPPEGAKRGHGDDKHSEKVRRYEEDPSPEKEAVRKRKCQDITWLIIFTIAVAAMGAIAYYSLRYGNTNRLIYARDSEGNLCGSDVGIDSARDLRNRTNLFYFDLADASSYKVCVGACYSGNLDLNTVVCQYDIEPASDADGKAQQVLNGTCAYPIDSKDVLNRCIPTILLADVRAAAEAARLNTTAPAMTASQLWGETLSKDFNARDVAQMVFQDLIRHWWVILICVGSAFILSFGWLLLLQYFAGAIVWLTISLVLLAAWGLGGYFIYNYLRITVLHQGFLATGFGQVDAALYNEKLLLALGCSIGGIALILTLIICCMMRRIRLATQIIKEASASMKAMPFVVLFPFVKYIVILAWMFFFIVVMALLATSGEVITGKMTGDLNDELEKVGKEYSSSHTLQYLQIYFTFGFLWVYNWILAIGQCVIAGAIASWYWARDKKAIPRHPVIRSLGRTLRYHLGSLALGSLLIAITQLIRLILVEMQRRLKGTGNNWAKYLLCCLQCCFKCIEKFLKMLTKNAYVEIAVYGYSFCTAARMAMQLIMANALRLVVLNKVGNFLVFIGKLAVVFITTLGGLGLMVYLEGSDEIFANYAVPLIFILIFTYITASAFLSTFSMAITTIFLSFCEDSQRNDGTRERPYYMSKNLQNFVDKHAHAKPVV